MGPLQEPAIACLVLHANQHSSYYELTHLEDNMTSQEFVQQLDARILKYDLLCHPFYKAWSEGKLSRNDLREYAHQYYHHVEAFPSYLDEFAARLPHGIFARPFSPLVTKNPVQTARVPT